MSWEVIIFYLLALVSILSAGGIVIASNPVHAGVFLILSLFNTAGIFVMLGAEFLAAVQVIVYAGAVLVLVLFVLMLVDPDDLPEFHAGRPVQRVVAILLGVILLLEVGIAILNRTIVGARGNADAMTIEFLGGNVQAVGNVLYSNYLLAFEVVSLVLLVGVIGAIVLALPERLGERIRHRRDTISLAHARGVDMALPEGVRGESPIPVPGARREEPVAEATRELIMTRDPDSYTDIGEPGEARFRPR
ncbi:MAG: NADH-quinone oxidoreductase subunit J [Chloroflexota bacterium]|nr:NADH-quinone oxidoreductase subunit J [Chloroflexota bacterium]